MMFKVKRRFMAKTLEELLEDLKKAEKEYQEKLEAYGFNGKEETKEK